MQFEEAISAKFADRFGTGITYALQVFLNGGAVNTLAVEHGLQVEAALVCAAAHHIGREAGALLVGENADRYRAACRNAGVIEGGHNLQSG